MNKIDLCLSFNAELFPQPERPVRTPRPPVLQGAPALCRALAERQGAAIRRPAATPLWEQPSGERMILLYSPSSLIFVLEGRFDLGK